jgi:steroid Delta-isomerase
VADPPTLEPEALKELVARYVEAASGRDLEAYASLFADDAVIVDPVGTPPYVGRDGVRAFRQMALDATTEMAFTAEGLRAAGDHVAFNFTVTGSVGDAKMVIQGIEIFVVDADRRIKSMTAIWGAEDFTAG